MVVGENGIVDKSIEATFKTELASAKEEFEMFKSSKLMENSEFKEESLNIGINTIDYNTKPDDEVANMKTIFSSLSDGYMNNIEIIKGEMYYKTTNEKEIEWLKSIGIEPNPYDIVGGLLLSSNSNLLLMDSNGTLKLPESVEAIDTGAFSKVEGLKTIIIPGSCKTIKTNAFSNNSTLEKVVIEEGVEKIEGNAFANCFELTDVVMANSVNYLGSSAFMNDKKLRNINLSSNLKAIAQYTFYGCSKLKNITIPNSIITIEVSAFNGTIIEKISLHGGIKTIGKGAFSNCINLNEIEVSPENTKYTYSDGLLLEKKDDNSKEIIFISPNALSTDTFTVPDGVKSLTNLLGSNMTIKKVVIPESVTSIEATFFTQYINQVTISSSNLNYEVIGNGVYEKGARKKLVRYFGDEAEVSLPEDLKIIGSFAFQFRKSLTSITIPDSVDKIGSQAFSVCTSLEELNLGENVNEVDSLFMYGSGIETLNINSENQYYKVQDEFLLSYDGKTLITTIGNRDDKTSLIIPNGVINLNDFAFHSLTNLTSVTLPNSLKKVGASFNYCTSLTEIEFPSSVEEISSTCFSNSPSVVSIIINNQKGVIENAPWGCVIGDRGITYK